MVLAVGDNQSAATIDIDAGGEPGHILHLARAG
jgi:hypothetical protein